MGPGQTFIAVDWQTLTPLLFSAADRAEIAARDVAARELNALAQRTVPRADAEFIPWQDDYIRRRITSNAKWLGRWFKSFGDTEATNQAHDADVQAKFADRWSPAPRSSAST
jgi:hypothetical protein